MGACLPSSQEHRHKGTISETCPLFVFLRNSELTVTELCNGPKTLQIRFLEIANPFPPSEKDASGSYFHSQVFLGTKRSSLLLKTKSLSVPLFPRSIPPKDRANSCLQGSYNLTQNTGCTLAF